MLAEIEAENVEQRRGADGGGDGGGADRRVLVVADDDRTCSQLKTVSLAHRVTWLPRHVATASHDYRVT